jgi:hypothetical protein
MNKHFSLFNDRLTIQGEHYIVSNGFVSKQSGDVTLRYNDLLSVEIVKRRSKRVMYAMLLCAGLLLLIMNVEFIPRAVYAVPAVLSCLFGAFYAFSVRQYVEITSMKGTYRIAAQRGDTEIESIVNQLQRCISNKK